MLPPITFNVDMPELSHFPAVCSTGVTVELAIKEDQLFSSIQGKWQFTSGLGNKGQFSVIQIDGEKSEGLPHGKVAAIFEKTVKAIKANQYTAKVQGNDLIITTKK